MATVIVIGILMALLFPVFGKVRERLDGAKCANNLKTLHAAASLYVQEKGSWPQIRAPISNFSSFSLEWIAALKPYGPEQASWICPTVQRRYGSPDLSQPGNARIDYLATSFDENPRRPFEYANQPWFAEVGDLHGSGNLLIFANGSVRPLNDIVKLP